GCAEDSELLEGQGRVACPEVVAVGTRCSPAQRRVVAPTPVPQNGPDHLVKVLVPRGVVHRDGRELPTAAKELVALLVALALTLPARIAVPVVVLVLVLVVLVGHLRRARRRGWLARRAGLRRGSDQGVQRVGEVDRAQQPRGL